MEKRHLKRAVGCSNRSVRTNQNCDVVITIVTCSPLRARSKVEVVKRSPAVAEETHATYTDIALHGKRGTRPETERLNEIALGSVAHRGADAIVLAGTDFSSFYANSAPEYPHLNVAQLHIDAIVRYAMAPRTKPETP